MKFRKKSKKKKKRLRRFGGNKAAEPLSNRINLLKNQLKFIGE